MSIYISSDGSVIFTVLFGTFLNLMYCMVVFYMSTGFTNKAGARAFKAHENKTILLIFLFGVARCLVSFLYLFVSPSRAECWVRVAWLQMWGEAG